MRYTTQKSGFSLIDTLLGVGMFLIITTSLVQFTMTTLHAADNLDMQLKAQNAAREGLEIMENIRGTNAMSFVNWDTPKQSHPRPALMELLQFSGLTTQQEVCVTVEPGQGVLPWTVQPLSCPAPGQPLPPQSMLAEAPRSTGGTLTQHTGSTSSRNLSRILRVRYAKNSESLRAFWAQFKDTRQDPPRDEDMIEVEAIVTWTTRGQAQELRLKKVLTDWYQ